MVVLKWLKQQRHHEDHYRPIVRVSTSSISQCCNSSGISMSSDGAGRLTGMEQRWHHLVSCSRLSTSNREGATTDSWQAEGRYVELIRRSRSQPTSVRHVSNASKLRRHVRRRRTVQSMKCQCGYLKDDPLWNVKPVKTDQCIGYVFRSPTLKMSLAAAQ